MACTDLSEAAPMWKREEQAIPSGNIQAGQPVLLGRLATSTSTADRDKPRHSWLGALQTCSAQLRPHVRATWGFLGTIMWLTDAFIFAESGLISAGTQLPVCSLAGSSQLGRVSSACLSGWQPPHTCKGTAGCRPVPLISVINPLGGPTGPSCGLRTASAEHNCYCARLALLA